MVDADGRDHDVTLHAMPKIICKMVYDRRRVRERIIETGAYEQMDAEWCMIMLNAAHMKIPMDLPYDKVKEMLDPLRGMP